MIRRKRERHLQIRFQPWLRKGLEAAAASAVEAGAGSNAPEARRREKGAKVAVAARVDDGVAAKRDAEAAAVKRRIDSEIKKVLPMLEKKSKQLCVTATAKSQLLLLPAEIFRAESIRVVRQCHKRRQRAQRRRRTSEKSLHKRRFKQVLNSASRSSAGEWSSLNYHRLNLSATLQLLAQLPLHLPRSRLQLEQVQVQPFTKILGSSKRMALLQVNMFYRSQQFQVKRSSSLQLQLASIVPTLYRRVVSIYQLSWSVIHGCRFKPHQLRNKHNFQEVRNSLCFICKSHQESYHSRKFWELCIRLQLLHHRHKESCSSYNFRVLCIRLQLTRHRHKESCNRNKLQLRIILQFMYHRRKEVVHGNHQHSQHQHQHQRMCRHQPQQDLNGQFRLLHKRHQFQ